MKQYNIIPIITDQFLDKYERCLTPDLLASLIKQLCIELNITNDYQSVDDLYAELGYVYDMTSADLAKLNISGTSDLQDFIVKQGFVS